MSLVKSPAEVEMMAEAGKRLAEILNTLKEEVRPGVETRFFDELSFKLVKKTGCEPAFLNYRPAGASRPYPATICVSVNDVIVHGTPSDYVIQEGDIVKLDLGLRFKGWYSDAALTIGAGKIGDGKKEFIETAVKALDLGIKQAVIGKTLGDIGFAVENCVKSRGFSVADLLTGHGIGRELHEEPAVYNFGRPGKGVKLESGMILAIEPMIAMGSGRVKQLKDESFATADGSLSAHFEHTVAVTEKEPRVLTGVDEQ